MALKLEKDEQSKKRLEKLEDELNENNQKAEELTREWQKEKAEIKEEKELKEKLDNLNFKLQNAFNSGDYKTASEIQYKEIPNVKSRLDYLEKNENNRNILSDNIGEDNIANIVSKMTNIPVSRITKGEKERVLNLDEILSKRVIGQDKAIK